MNTQKWLIVIAVSLILIVGVVLLLLSADTTKLFPSVSVASPQATVPADSSVTTQTKEPIGGRSAAELTALFEERYQAIRQKIISEAANRKYTEEEKDFISDSRSFVIRQLLKDGVISEAEAVQLRQNAD